MEHKGEDNGALKAAEAAPAKTSFQEELGAAQQWREMETQPTWAQTRWANIKSKVRATKEYAALRTQQTLSMLGVTSKADSGTAVGVEPSDKGGAAKDESQLEHCS